MRGYRDFWASELQKGERLLMVTHVRQLSGNSTTDVLQSSEQTCVSLEVLCCKELRHCNLAQ